MPERLISGAAMGVQAEICSSCGAAVAGASLLWPDPELQGLCSVHCGYQF